MSRRTIWLLAVLASLGLPTIADAYRPNAPVATVPAIKAPRGPGLSGAWPQWGNVVAYGAPSGSGIADCTFAAAADWELMMLGRAPSEAQLISEYHRAGGSNSEGMPVEDFARWWLVRGIGGIRVKLIPRPNSWLDALVQIHGAVIVESSQHIMIVAGFNSTGPEVITYGETRQETWAEWDASEDEIYVPEPVN